MLVVVATFLFHNAVRKESNIVELLDTPAKVTRNDYELKAILFL